MTADPSARPLPTGSDGLHPRFGGGMRLPTPSSTQREEIHEPRPKMVRCDATFLEDHELPRRESRDHSILGHRSIDRRLEKSIEVDDGEPLRLGRRHQIRGHVTEHGGGPVPVGADSGEDRRPVLEALEIEVQGPCRLGGGESGTKTTVAFGHVDLRFGEGGGRHRAEPPPLPSFPLKGGREWRGHDDPTIRS